MVVESLGWPMEQNGKLVGQAEKGTAEDRSDTRHTVDGEWDMGWRAALDMSTKGHPRAKENVCLNTGGGIDPQSSDSLLPTKHKATPRQL